MTSHDAPQLTAVLLGVFADDCTRVNCCAGDGCSLGVVVLVN